MDKMKLSSIIAIFFAGTIAMLLGIWTRGYLISMFLIIGGGIAVTWAFIKLLLFTFYKEPEMLDNSVEMISSSREPIKDVIQTDITERSLIFAGGRNKGL